jgi:hypothetical protein
MNPQPDPLDEPVALPVPAEQPAADRREQSDRRQQPTSIWGAFPPAGQRMRYRRAHEHLQPYFTDRFSPSMLMCVLALIFVSLLDAGLTIYVLYGGGSEINPLMNYLLSHSTMTFVVGKYVLTVIGLPVLLIFQNHYLFSTRLRVGYLIPFSVAMYSVLIGYQIILIDHNVGW